MRQMQNDARMSHTSLHRTANGFKSFHKDIFIGLILWAFGIIKKKMSGKKKNHYANEYGSSKLFVCTSAELVRDVNRIIISALSL